VYSIEQINTNPFFPVDNKFQLMLKQNNHYGFLIQKSGHRLAMQYCGGIHYTLRTIVFVTIIVQVNNTFKALSRKENALSK